MPSVLLKYTDFYIKLINIILKYGMITFFSGRMDVS